MGWQKDCMGLDDPCDQVMTSPAKFLCDADGNARCFVSSTFLEKNSVSVFHNIPLKHLRTLINKCDISGNRSV